MRTGESIQPLNISVKRAEERPDSPQGELVFRLRGLAGAASHFCLTA